MNEEHDSSMDEFEKRLRAGLKRLAEDAPAWSGAGEVLGALERRFRRRATIGTIAALAGIAALTTVSVLWLSDAKTRSTTEVTALPGPTSLPTVPGLATPAPLDPRDGLHETRERLAKFFASLGVPRAEVQKDPGDRHSFAFAGALTLSADRLRGDVEALLEKYPYARISFFDGNISFSFMR